MKIDKKEQDFGADGAQSAQLCGLNRPGGGFSYTLAPGRKRLALHVGHGAANQCRATQIASLKGMRSPVAPF
jgi:hypothetical protein